MLKTGDKFIYCNQECNVITIQDDKAYYGIKNNEWVTVKYAEDNLVKGINEEKATRYNEGKTDWSQVSFKALEPMVRVLMYGANKYGKDNWRKGHDRSELLSSAMRHLTALFDNEENDDESKLSHAAHVMSNMMFYIYHFVIKK